MRHSIFVSLLILSVLQGCSTTNHNLKDAGDAFDNHLVLGGVFRNGGHLAEALREFKAAVYLRPDSDEAHFMLGEVYYQMYLHSHDEAQRKYTEDTVKDMFKPDHKAPNPNITRDELKRVYESYGERTDYCTQAFQEYATAAKLNPKNWMAHYFVAVDHENNKRFREAVEEYKQALSANPNSEISYSGLGKSYYELGYYELAIDNFKKAIALTHEVSITDYELGLVYVKIGEKNKAIDILEKLKTNGFDPQYNSLYSSIYGQYPPEFLKQFTGD